MRAIDVAAEARELASRLDIFRGIKHSDLFDGIVERFKYREFVADTAILRAGDDSDGMYLLLSGQAHAVANDVPVGIIEAGDIFGEMSLISGEVRSSDVVASADTLCAFLHGDDFELLLKSIPRIASNIMRILSLRIRRLNELMIAARLSLPQTAGEQAFDTPMALLRAVPMFADVTDEKFLSRVLSYMKTVDIAPGEALFARNDPGDLMYVVASGEVLVHLDRLELMRLGPGQYFGEMSLLDSSPRSTSVTASSAASLMTLTRPQFHAALSQSPAVARNILHALSNRIRSMNTVLTGDGRGQALGALALTLFPEVTRDDLWKKDPTSGAWHLPLTEALAAEYADIAVEQVELPSHFQRALDADAAELDAAFHRCHDARPSDVRLSEKDFTALLDFSPRLFAKLRSTLVPRKIHATLALGLYEGMQRGEGIDVHIVLASPTALAEISDFLDVASLFKAIGTGVKLHAHLIRWENIIDVTEFDLPTRAATFAAIERDVADRLVRAGFANHVLSTVDVAAADPIGAANAPRDVMEVIKLVETAVSDLGSADPSISRNLLWITGFYARQASLQKLGAAQPLIDLAIRTSIGRRVGDLYRRMNLPTRRGFVLLTSELNGRFVQCYEDGMPIANIALAGRS